MDRQMYYVRRISDKSRIKDRAISNTFGKPAAGRDEEYLPIFIDDIPAFDENFSMLVVAEGVNEVTSRYEITYSVQDRPQEDVLKSADDAARIKVREVVPIQDLIETLVRALDAIIQVQGLKFTEEQQPFINAITAQAEKLAANRDNLNAIKDAITNGEKPDLNGGYDAIAVEVDATPVAKPRIP